MPLRHFRNLTAENVQAISAAAANEDRATEVQS